MIYVTETHDGTFYEVNDDLGDAIMNAIEHDGKHAEVRQNEDGGYSLWCSQLSQNAYGGSGKMLEIQAWADSQEQLFEELFKKWQEYEGYTIYTLEQWVKGRADLLEQVADMPDEALGVIKYTAEVLEQAAKLEE